MTYATFTAICEQHCILPGIVLDNDDIEQALRDGATPALLHELIESEF